MQLRHQTYVIRLGFQGHRQKGIFFPRHPQAHCDFLEGFSLAVRLFSCSHAVLVESHLFCTTLDLQLSFNRPLCYNSKAHCPLLKCLRTTSAILTGAHSYFVVSSFKYEGENSYRDLITSSRMKHRRLSVQKEIT